MKTLFLALTATGCICFSSNAQVYLNEILANPPGSDSSTSRGLEFFELRGTPNMSLSGYYLLGLEGQGTTTKGDINQFFDLGAFSIGANGYLAAVQYNSPYSITAGATVVSNTFSYGWGQANTAVGSSAGHNSDASQLDFENSATTLLLVNIGSGVAPETTTDLDTDDNGTLDLPSDWSVLDSVGLSDGTGTQTASEVSYGAITFRIKGIGSDNNGNVVDVPGTAPSLYAFRRGESTGSNPSDWVASSLTGTFPEFVLTNSTDASFNDHLISELSLGGINLSAVPEPSTWALMGCGIAALGLFKARRFTSRKN